MKKSTIIISVSGLSILSFTVLYVQNNKSKQENTTNVAMQDNGYENHLFGKELYLDSKMDEFNHLSDVEKTTDEIVIAEKIAQDELTVIYGVEGRIDIAYTLSTFRVNKVIDSKVLKENEAYDKKEDVTYHISGYNLIKADKEYLE